MRTIEVIQEDLAQRQQERDNSQAEIVRLDARIHDLMSELIEALQATRRKSRKTAANDRRQTDTGGSQ